VRHLNGGTVPASLHLYLNLVRTAASLVENCALLLPPFIQIIIKSYPQCLPTGQRLLSSLPLGSWSGL
jgi:hypothetical protein